MVSQQLLIRKDIEAILASWKQDVHVQNDDVFSSAERVARISGFPAALISVVRSQTGVKQQNSSRYNVYRVNIFILYPEIYRGCTIEKYSEEYDLVVGEAATIIDFVYEFMTEEEVNLVVGEKLVTVKNEIRAKRKYTDIGQTLDFVDQFIDYGSDRLVGVEARFFIGVPKKNCTDCSLFDQDIFDKVC